VYGTGGLQYFLMFEVAWGIQLFHVYSGKWVYQKHDIPTDFPAKRRKYFRWL